MAQHNGEQFGVNMISSDQIDFEEKIFTSAQPTPQLITSEIMRWERPQEKRKLSMAQKISIIKENEKGKSQRQLAKQHSCSKSHIHNILKNKEILLKEWAENGYEESCNSNNVSDSSTDAVSNIGFSFNSNNPYDVKMESNHELSTKLKLDAVVKYILCKTRLDFNLLPIRHKLQESLQNDQNKVTLIFCASNEGEKDNVAIVCTSSLLKREELSQKEVEKLGITCYVNSTGLITSDIMNEWLQKFNNKLTQANQSALLLLCDDLSYYNYVDVSNVALKFYSQSHSLSKLSELLTNYLKIGYRKKLLKYVLVETKLNGPCATSLCNAIGWIYGAWKNVSPTAIQNAFLECLLSSATHLFSAIPDAFHELELQHLQNSLNVPPSQALPANVYATCDNQLPSCKFQCSGKVSIPNFSSEEPKYSIPDAVLMSSLRDAFDAVTILRKFATKIGNPDLFHSILNTQDFLIDAVIERTMSGEEKPNDQCFPIFQM